MTPPRPSPPHDPRPERRAPRIVELGVGQVRLRVVEEWQEAVHAAGLCDAAGLRETIEALAPDSGRAAGRARTRVIQTGRGGIFVKRALKGGALAPLFVGRIPRFARAVGELEATARLWARGAPVLEPVLAAGVRDARGWLALVGTVDCPDTLDGASALAAHARGSGSSAPGPLATATDVTTDIVRSMGRSIRAFHDAGGTHADLAVTNLLVDPRTGLVRVVDLQGARVGPPPGPARRRRELRRLRRSIEHRPEIRGGLADVWPALEAGYREAARADAAEARSGDAPSASSSAEALPLPGAPLR